MMRLVLASASPARLTLLRAAGFDPEVIVSGVDETGGTPGDLALAKAVAVAKSVTGDAVVIGCDSMLELDGELLGKPSNPDEARVRWQHQRGRSAVLQTGHALIDVATGRQLAKVATTIVHFANITDAEIDAYVATGEPLGVAGAFTIDGRGGLFVERIEGDHSNVIGLSLPLLRTMLADMEIDVTRLWR